MESGSSPHDEESPPAEIETHQIDNSKQSQTDSIRNDTNPNPTENIASKNQNSAIEEENKDKNESKNEFDDLSTKNSNKNQNKDSFDDFNNSPKPNSLGEYQNLGGTSPNANPNETNQAKNNSTKSDTEIENNNNNKNNESNNNEKNEDENSLDKKNEKEKQAIENPVLVFGGIPIGQEADEGEEDDFEDDEFDDDNFGGEGRGGMDLCAHQPTFVNLAGLVPKGCSSINDIHVVEAKKPEKPLPGCLAPSESLSQLKMQNEGKWAEIGYDPNRGKGDIKTSFTLSQFNPSKLLPNGSENQKKLDPAEEINALLGLNDEEAPLKLPKPANPVKRVNSSRGPQKNIVEESDDSENDGEEEEDEAEEEKIEEWKPYVPGDISQLLKMQPIIQSDDEDYDENKDENNENECKNIENEDEIVGNESEDGVEEEDDDHDTDTQEISVSHTRDIENIVFGGQPGNTSSHNSSRIDNPNPQNSYNSKSENNHYANASTSTNASTNTSSPTNKNNNQKNNKNSGKIESQRKSAKQSHADNNDPKALIQFTKPNRRGEEPKKPYKFMREPQPFMERNNMFLTQVEEEQKIARASRNDDDSFSQKKVFDYYKYKEIGDAYDLPVPKKAKRANSILNQRPKIFQPFPTYRPKPPLNLSPYDDCDYDYEKEQKKIPPRLLEIIKFKPQSLTFKALCQIDIIEYPKKAINQVVMDLKGLLEKCINLNMIGESSYVDCIINNLKIDLKKLGKKTNHDDEKIEHQIEQAETSFDERRQHWKEQKNILECERDLALEDLDLKNQEEIANLDEEWNSEKMQSRYNKPSPKLIELRQHARALLNARNFDEAQAIADQISKQEAYETKEAYVRMQREYRQAQEHLSNKYKNDRESLIDGFQSKMNGLLTAESNDLRPFEQRIENLHKVKKNMEITKKINAKNHINDKSQIKKSPLAVRTPPLVLNAKLKLPPLKAAPTRQATRASSKL